MVSFLEPIHLEFSDGANLFMSPRHGGSSVSYALGEFDSRELAGVDIEEFNQLSEDSRWAYIICEAKLASARTVAIMNSTNAIHAGPQVYWCDTLKEHNPILSVCTSIMFPDETPLERILEILHKTKIPTSVINAEIERIQHVRWHVHHYGR